MAKFCAKGELASTPQRCFPCSRLKSSRIMATPPSVLEGETKKNPPSKGVRDRRERSGGWRSQEVDATADDSTLAACGLPEIYLAFSKWESG